MLENALTGQRRWWLFYYFTLGGLLLILAATAAPLAHLIGYSFLAVAALIKFIADINGARKIPSEKENRSSIIARAVFVDIIPTFAVFVFAALTAVGLTGITGGTPAELFFTTLMQTATPIAITAAFAITAFNALLDLVYYFYQWASLRFSDDVSEDTDSAYQINRDLNDYYRSLKKSIPEFLILAGIAAFIAIAFFAPFEAIKISNFALVLAAGFVVATLLYINYAVPRVDSIEIKKIEDDISTSPFERPNSPSPEVFLQAAGSHFRTGIDHYNNRNYQDALTSFSSALENNQKLSSNAAFLTYYGNTQYHLENYQVALEIFQQLPRITQRNLEYHKGMGQTFYKMKRYAEALTHFQTLTQLDPQDSVAWNNLGKTFYQLGRQGEALIALKKSFELQQPSDAKNSLGRLISLLEHQAASTAAPQESASQSTFQP